MASKILFVCLILLGVGMPAWVPENNTAPTYKAFRRFVFRNQCPQTLWVGGFGVPLPSRTGWEMGPGAQESLDINANTVAIRFWARTGCSWRDGKFIC